MILVTGSSGHLGEAIRRLAPDATVGPDMIAGQFTNHRIDIRDAAQVGDFLAQLKPRAIIHAATLHNPHVATHSRQDLVDTNVTGTLNLLENAARHRVQAFVYTSTTSTFGRALSPPPGAPAVWITADTVPVPKNIYGVTRALPVHTGSNSCENFRLSSRKGLQVVVVSRPKGLTPRSSKNSPTRWAI